MAVAILTGCFSWSALGTKDCARFNCPKTLSQLRFFEDTDPVGAAAELVLRLKDESQEVKVVVPPFADHGIARAVRWRDAWMIEAGECVAGSENGGNI